MLKFYYLARIIRRIRIPSFYKCDIDKTAKVSSGSSLSKVRMGRYSYTGANCRITEAVIGNFCSVGGGCGIGGGIHPMEHVSTSPVFLKGRNIMRKNFSHISYTPSDTVYIGNDVWIGDGAFIRSGIHIGDGAVIGARSVVTHDVEPYSIVAGIPAKEIRKRFDTKTIAEMLEIKWWNWHDEELIKYAQFFDNPQKLINKVTKDG